MSDHDHLMHELIRLQKLLEQYNEEYEPEKGHDAWLYLKLCATTVANFTNKPQYL